ncbi:MAG: hypothetical protein KME10_12110 [Plectolyngbya sp. WJT66-NPBG17]|jgi:photosystem II stability/assembly factor-like uncharacterized protein|nr:hypothetical protein [Plectolyngbya sp. WJT66-NPBG17]
MNMPTDRLSQLLPDIYRAQDKRGELRSLLSILQNELELLEDNVDDLYEDWFIETCSDWVVPYIGDLLGVSGVGTRSINPNRQSTYGQQERRAFVANTLAYRRRKGTAPVVEQLARDVTGWRARVVEFFDRLAITQNINHIRSNNATVSLRNPTQLLLLGSPFEQQVAYSAEVREQGKYNIPNVGLFLWRLQSYPVAKGTAQVVQEIHESLRERCFTFSSLGNIPLFNPPQTETEITQLAEEINVPGKLRADPNYPGYQGEQPALQIFINGSTQPIPPQEVLITTSLLDQNTKLESFQRLPAEIAQSPKETKIVAVNPEVGRLAFLDAQPPTQVAVTYAYGFSHDVGGGAYDRSDSISQFWVDDAPTAEPIQYFPSLYWEVEEARSPHQNPLAEAIQTWNGTVQAWSALHDLRAIPIARVAIPRTQASRLSHTRPRFRAGIVDGFNTIATIGEPEFVINPGRAIDQSGCPINFAQSVLIRLNELDPKLLAERMLWVIVSYWSDPVSPRYQLNIVPHSQIEQYPEETYIRITALSVDMQGNIQQQLDPQTLPFRSGIAEGLTIITPPETLEVIVTPGIAVDYLGRSIQLDRNIPIDLRAYQNQTIVLAIAYSECPADANWRIHIILKEDLDLNPDTYPNNLYIQLAELFVPSVTIVEETPTPSSLELRPAFRAGIIQGLVVQATQGARSVTIEAGQALDRNARRIELEKDYLLERLGVYRGETITIAITYRAELFAPRWEIKILRTEEESKCPADQYLRLARLQISWTGKLTALPIDLRRKFKPGIVQGLSIEKQITPAKVKVSAGQVVDSTGEVVRLEEPCEIDLGKYPGRDLFIFLESTRQPGWKPLDIKTDDLGSSWQHLGAVPVEPQTLDTNKMGVVFIKDNRTYKGDLDIVVPSSEQLQTKLMIVAANGYRPHVQGQISIQGIIPYLVRRSALFEPGELTIDGLLIEGKVTVQAGELKHLEIAHCTLVPRYEWGLEVQATELLQPFAIDEDPCDHTEEEEQNPWSLIAIVLYAVSILNRLIRLGFGSHDLSPQQRLQLLIGFTYKEFETLWCALQEELYQFQQQTETEEWWCLEPMQVYLGSNRELTIALTHSISGPIHLPDSVLNLKIESSIIDHGAERTDSSRQLGESAIAAPGAMLEVDTTTILGTTKARSIQASDSIFDELVRVRDQQVGCMRFCSVPPGSQTPSRYRCQPDLALQELQTLPPAITALAIASNHQRFLGTVEQGVFQSQPDQPIWQQTQLKDRTISALIADSQDILAGTSIGEIFQSTDGNPWTLAQVVTNVEVTAFAAYTHPEQGRVLLAGTAGNGIFKANSQPNQWEPMGSESLANQNVTEIAIDPENRIFVGTESGVFRWSKRRDLWRLVGLEDQSITALAIDSDKRIFAATNEGQVFRSSDLGNRWILASKNLTQAKITALAVQSLARSAMLEGLVLKGEATQVLKEGSAVTIQGHTRTIQTVNFEPETSKFEAIVDREFCPELSGEITFSTHFLFAATAGSGIYRSTNHGNFWKPVISAPRLSDRNITALTIASDQTSILAGTAIGNVLHSQDHGDRWTPLNQGLNEVDKVLPLLTRIQPIYKSPNYGQPDYCQLNQTCALEIRQGAEDGSELGVFSVLKQSQREENLRTLLQEYLRFGLTAELFYMT